MISLEEFRRIELRIGGIVAAEPIPGSDRLLKLVVDVGGETRTVVGSLAYSYTREELRGMQGVVATNLAPARIRGIESQGMLLGVGCEDPRAATLLTVHRPVSNGAIVT